MRSNFSLLLSILAALTTAVLALLFLVLPAEYGIDPTGMGERLGLRELGFQKTSKQSKELKLATIDTVGGNEQVLDLKPTQESEPVPLPNPEVFQYSTNAPASDSQTLTLQSGEQTEFKVLMKAGQMINFSWKVDQGSVYSDFHGHEVAEAVVFVRYQELMQGTEEHGALSAPFAGEHGWYWVNVGETPVTIAITINGFYEKIQEYKISSPLPF